jgi:hypothetical protein
VLGAVAHHVVGEVAVPGEHIAVGALELSQSTTFC